MKFTLQIACCCLIFAAAEAYRPDDDRKLVFICNATCPSGRANCPKENRHKEQFIHIFNDVSLDAPGQEIYTIPGVNEPRQCVQLIEFDDGNRFLTAQYYSASNQCIVYSTDPLPQHRVNKTVGSSLVISGQDYPCSERINPCQQENAKCFQTDRSIHYCKCEACSTWTVPEKDWPECPSVYIDFSGQDSPCIPTAGLTIETQYGKFGKGLHVNDAESWKIDPKSASGVAPITCNESFSVAFWMRRTTDGINYVISVTNDTANDKMYVGFSIRIQGAYTYFFSYDLTTSTEYRYQTEKVSTEQWNHYAYTFNGTKIHGYLNGTEWSGSEPKYSRTIECPDQAVMYIGKLESDGYVRGGFDIDEIFIFSYILEANDMTYFQ